MENSACRYNRGQRRGYRKRKGWPIQAPSPAAALPRVEKLAKEITSGGGSALFVRTDVAREDDIVALVEKTVGTFGALHIALNNAGTEGQFGLLTTEQTVEHYHQVCDINIRGVLLSMKHEITRCSGPVVVPS
jgi:NAD(P)-dependent dehydrogenase (short-subunit alcohol dehydrogenase family)